MKELHGGRGEPHLETLVNEAVGNAVKMAIHHGVIVNVHTGFQPGGHLKGRERQRLELGLVEGDKPIIARALQFLKGLGIERLDPRSNGGVEFTQAEERQVA